MYDQPLVRSFERLFSTWASGWVTQHSADASPKVDIHSDEDRDESDDLARIDTRRR